MKKNRNLEQQNVKKQKKNIFNLILNSFRKKNVYKKM